MKTRICLRSDLMAFLRELENQGVSVRSVPGGAWINRNWKNGTGDIMFGAEPVKETDGKTWRVKWDKFFDAAMQKVTDESMKQQLENKPWNLSRH